MGLFVLALFCLLSLACYGYSTNKPIICKDVDDVSADVTNSDVHTRRLIGLKVEEATCRLRVKVDEMEIQIQNLTRQISETRALRVTEPQTTTQPTTVVRCVGGVIHKGICYWAKVHSYPDTNYAKAQGICSNKDSTLADIYGKVHYDLIMNFLREKLHGNRVSLVWTGMKKIYGNNIAQLSNGSPAPYTRQLSYNWDNADSSHTHVYLEVQSSTNHPEQGMGAFPPSYSFQGTLCQTE